MIVWWQSHVSISQNWEKWYGIIASFMRGEPMKKLIYLEDAINEIARWIGYLDKDMISRIQIGLERLPSAQPEQRWIPCTPDTMPKPMQKVLITFEEYDQLWVTSARFIYYRKTLQWDCDFGSCGEVKAWMPLPEPYGGE